MDIRFLKTPLFKRARQATVSAGVFPGLFVVFRDRLNWLRKICHSKFCHLLYNTSHSALNFSYMPPKRFCPKCEQIHEKPTGPKCMRMATAADIETGAFYANGHSCTSVSTMTTTLTYSSSHLEVVPHSDQLFIPFDDESHHPHRSSLGNFPAPFDAAAHAHGSMFLTTTSTCALPTCALPTGVRSSAPANSGS